MIFSATQAFFGDSLATLLINSSLSVQKLGHREVEALKMEGRRAHCRSFTWWVGVLIMVSGVFVHLITLPYGDMTLFAANCSVAIIVNLVLAIWLFNEKFIWKIDLIAMMFIITGAFCIVALSNKEK